MAAFQVQANAVDGKAKIMDQENRYDVLCFEFTASHFSVCK
jgi:hypothetical protein